MEDLEVQNFDPFGFRTIPIRRGCFFGRLLHKLQTLELNNDQTKDTKHSGDPGQSQILIISIQYSGHNINLSPTWKETNETFLINIQCSKNLSDNFHPFECLPVQKCPICIKVRKTDFYGK